jgi:LysM repeat protein
MITQPEGHSLLHREFAIPMFGGMRRIFLVLSLCACWPLSLNADDRAAEAAARAQREEAEERYKLLNGKLESLTETQELLLKNQDKLLHRINALTAELDEFKRAQTRAGANFVTQPQLKELVEKLQEIDKKRVTDNENVLKVLKELQKVPVAAVPVPEKSSSPPVQEPLGPTWDYFVKTNDTLKKIVMGYNKDLGKQGYALLTVSQVLKANPGLNQDKLYAGKKILIPIPPKKEEKAGKGKNNN